MVQKVRIARTETSTLHPSLHENRPIWQFHPQLTSFIRRYLQPASASVLAEPLLVPGAAFVEWYSDIGGQPVPYSSLPAREKERAAKLLSDRLSALRDLAARHPDNPLSSVLATVSALPPEDAVYVLNGQPVVIGWGRLSAGAAMAVPASRIPATPVRPAEPPTAGTSPDVAAPAATAATAAAGTATVAAAPKRGCLWATLIGLLLLLLLLLLIWWKFWPLPWLSPALPDTTVTTDTSQQDRLAALQAEEDKLRADIAKAEKDLAARLAACPAPATLPDTPPAPDPTPVPPVTEPAPLVPPQPEQPKTEVPKREPPQEPTKADPPKPQPAKPPVTKEAPPPQKETPPKDGAAKAPPKSTPQQASCPPPRKKWEAPELVILLDSSGSMALKAGVSEAEIRSLIARARGGDGQALRQLESMQGGTGNDRLSAAKTAVDYTVSTLPKDMDVGLVVFGKCQGADNYKFFSPAERGELRSRLSSITPQKGTPLARGIERAGNMVDGRSVPATLVVVTDGEDSCGGDPCATARALKASKPNLTINVIDVNGMGEGRCIADATGGKLLTMKSIDDLPKLVQQASGEKPVPANCPQ